MIISTCQNFVTRKMQQKGFRNKEMEKGRNPHFTGEVCDQADIGDLPIDNHNLDSVTHIMK
jgi:hypothetical protein